MTIAEAHAGFILERIFLEYLKDGTILTADQLQEKFNEYKKTHTDLSKPVSQFEDFDVTRGGESSASQIQDIASAISDDVSIVSRELKNIVGKSQGFYERWTIEVQRLLNKSRRLEHDIDTLLLLQGDTAGYFAHVSDNFADLNKVDTANTDAKIDVREGSVTINPYNSYPSDSSGGSRIDLSDLTDYDVTFSVLSTTPVGYTNTGDSTPLNAVTSPTAEGNNWIGTVAKNETGDVSAELKIRLSATEDKEISRILFESSTQNAGGSPTITCQWSLDGYQWYMVDDPTPTKSLQGNTVSWSFPLTKMRWVKFLFIKNNYDYNEGGTYWYEFGARSIRLFGHEYNIDTTDILQTIAQQPMDAEGEPVLFTKAAFEACEMHRLDDDENQVTDIAYYIAASEDGETEWTEWVRVSPLQKENPNYPSAVLFGGSKRLDNMNITEENSEFFLKFNDSVDLTKLTNDFDWVANTDNRYLGYNFKNPDFVVSNTVIPLLTDPTDSDSDVVNANYLGNSVEIWRNVFDSSAPDKKVRDQNAGWGFEDDEYYCSFYVVNSKGIVFDFGDTECVIDGVPRTGEVRVYRGVHTFRTKQQNWSDFYVDDSSYNLSTEEQLMAADPLYPYNHKMILEGFPYNPNEFTGEKVYKGVDILAQHYGVKTSAFDLENNIPTEDSLKYFAFVKGVGRDEFPACAVLLRRDINYNDYADELCRVVWKPGEGRYRYLRMKAEFTSNDVTKTSTLYSYRIKAGV